MVYTLKNTRQAAAIFQEVYPQVVPTGLAPEAALDRTATLLKTVSEKWTLDKPGEKWGESDLKVYQSLPRLAGRAKTSSSLWMRRRSQPTTWSATSTRTSILKSVEQALARQRTGSPIDSKQDWSNLKCPKQTSTFLRTTLSRSGCQ